MFLIRIYPFFPLKSLQVHSYCYFTFFCCVVQKYKLKKTEDLVIINTKESIWAVFGFSVPQSPQIRKSHFWCKGQDKFSYFANAESAPLDGCIWPGTSRDGNSHWLSNSQLRMRQLSGIQPVFLFNAFLLSFWAAGACKFLRACLFHSRCVFM